MKHGYVILWLHFHGDMEMQVKKSTLPLMTKMAIGFSTVILILTVAVSITIWQVHNLNSATEKLVSTQIPAAQTSEQLLSGIYHVSAAFRGYLLTKQSAFIDEKDEAWQNEIQPNYDKLQKTIANQADIDDINAINNLLIRYKAIINQASQATSDAEAFKIFQENVTPIVTNLKIKLKDIVSHQNQLMTMTAKRLAQNTYRLLLTEWLLLGLGILIGVVLSIKLSRNIVNPIAKISEVTDLIAKGNLDKGIAVTGAKEIHQLASSVNQMVNTMKEITNVAASIADGDYHVKISPRSDQDKLIHALTHMTETLRKGQIYYEEQTWLQKGINSIVSTIAKNNELSKLCNNALNEICHYLAAGVGVLHLKQNNQDKLNLIASFSFVEREGLSNHFNYGEGVIGQVAKEGKAILLKNIKRQDMVISTGVTEEPPINTYTLPLIDRQETVGVIELGFHESISQQQIDYLTQIIPILASSIKVAQQQEITELLLDEQRKLAVELQQQQEELKTSNEELEAQTEELKTSEEELRVRDEEQKVLNEELERRNKELSEQKIQLEKAQLDLVSKSEEALLSSKYKTDFLANMSHELRTPLNSLLLLAKLLLDNGDGNLNKDQLESIKVICSSGEELLQLINDILDLAKVESGKLTIKTGEIQLEEFLLGLERDFQHIAKNKQIKFILKMADNLPPTIITDAQRLRQIIKNLLSNAFKFTDHGEIILSIDKPNKAVKLIELSHDNCISFSVKDSGKGIEKDKQQMIFQNFYQIDSASNRKYAGTGLGLSISMQLARLLGGEIQVESEVDKGSIFTLYLPEKTSINTKDIAIKFEENINKEIDLSAVNAIASEASDKESLLMIVEDDVQFAQILKNICEKKGFKCLHAVNGKDALSLVEKKLPIGILMDMNLPDMSGLEISDCLKKNEKTSHIPIHFISGIDNREEAMRHGAVSHIMKPITIEQLNSAISGISQAVGNQIESLLLIEDDENMQITIGKLFKNRNVQVETVSTAKKALEMLAINKYDCMILDLGLPDMPGIEFLRKLSANDKLSHPPVIIYTGRELTEEDNASLRQYSDNIIIKGKASLDRLADEATLFLHHIIENNAKSSKKIILPEKDAHKKHFSGKKVLLVDDDIRNTFALAKVLRTYDIEVVIAPNGREGIDLLDAEKGIDAILMDIMMPIMDGFEAIQKIREKSCYSDLPIIALTAKTMPADREKCLSVGATDYLSKPLDMDKLLTLLRAWI